MRQLTLAVSAALLASTASAQVLQDTQRLNTNGFNPQGNNAQDGIAAAVSGTTIHVAWADQFGTDQFSQDIYYCRSTDDGATYSTPVRVDLGDGANAFDSDFAKIACSDDGQKVVVVWQELRDAIPAGGAGQDCYYNVSQDGGLTWLPAALPLNTTTAGTDVTSDIDRIWLTASGDAFHCTWEEDWIAGGGAEETWYTRSTDGGLTWSTPIILSPATGSDDVDEPRVAAEGNLVIVAYVDVNNDIVIHRSTDGGANFSPAIAVESDTAGNADECFVDVLGSTVLIGWTEDTAAPGGEEAHCAVSHDGGVTWMPEETLSVAQAAVSGSDIDGPSVAIQSPLNMFVVYDDDSASVSTGGSAGSAGNTVLLAYTNDGGLTWTKDVPVNAGLVSNRGRVQASSSVVTVCFEQGADGGNIIAFTSSLDGGLTWSAPLDVTSSGTDSDLTSPIESTDFVMSELTDTATVVFHSNISGTNEQYACGVRHDVNVGTNYCQGVPNSTGNVAVITANGSPIASSNNFAVAAHDLPPNQFGIFVVSRTQSFVPGAGGTSNGNLCVSGNIGRFVGPGQILSAGAAGEFSLQVDLGALPQGGGTVAVSAGDTWNFQAWYRDGVGLGSNFTDGVSVDFQ